MRYDCDDDAFAGDFVEFSDSWSRRQTMAAYRAWGNIRSGLSDEEAEVVEEGLLATLRPKIIALRLTCVDAEPITDADDLTPARTQDMDRRLYMWWVNIWIVHLKNLTDLGEALGRRLFTISAPELNGMEKETAVAP